MSTIEERAISDGQAQSDGRLVVPHTQVHGYVRRMCRNDVSETSVH